MSTSAPEGVKHPSSRADQAEMPEGPRLDTSDTGALAALGEALRARAGNVSEMVLAGWRARRVPGATLATQISDDILRVTRIATLAVANYLVTGQSESEDDRRTISATGKAPLRDTISLSDLTKLYLGWRDATIHVIEREADALGLRADLVARVADVVRIASDSSIVRMTKQFDAERRRLQIELGEEQQRLEHHAFHDALTDLPNRLLFFDRLAHALDVAARRCGRAALLFVDIDHFKSVNDRFGHAVGDGLLVAVAQRLLAAVRTGDTVARLGGDEFVVLCEDVRDPASDPIDLATRITATLREPFRIARHTIDASASVGITVTDGDDDADGFLMRADHAMYRAKRDGRGSFHVWSAE